MRADRDRVHHLYLKRVEADNNNDKGFEPVDEAGIPSYLSNAARCAIVSPLSRPLSRPLIYLYLAPICDFARCASVPTVVCLLPIYKRVRTRLVSSDPLAPFAPDPALCSCTGATTSASR